MNQQIKEDGIRQDGGVIINPPFPNNYAKEFLVLEKGKGSWVYDVTGKKYLDLSGGIAVNSFGHSPKSFQWAVKRQMKKLVHVSNLFTTMPAVDFAQALTSSSPRADDQPWQPNKHPGYFQAVHFGNSGAEANEAAIKYARIYSKRKPSPNGSSILAFTNGFHGRTLGALAVTHTPKYREPYEPLMGGVVFADYNNPQQVKDLLTKDFCAVIVEPVQGEGGLSVMTPEFVQSLHEARDTFDLLIIADEVQTGLGRLGTLYGSQAVGLEPDIITLSKPIAGGIPLSATLLPAKVNQQVHVGDHGTTFGGGPLTTAVGLALWKELNSPGMLESIQRKAQVLENLLQELTKLPKVVGLKSLGMLRGIELESSELIPLTISKARQKGLLILRSGTSIIRIAPAFNLSDKELKLGIELLKQVLEDL
jgi:acetylornithine/N-succinyldiaminopimelate aminotransferase